MNKTQLWLREYERLRLNPDAAQCWFV